MATISFKAKIQETGYAGSNETWRQVKIPNFSRSHCDMNAFRKHPKYGGYANSDLFLGMLNRIKSDIFGTKSFMRLDQIPDGVIVDDSGFLCVVTIDV